MKIVAHRGANKEAPENSMAAFKKAVEIGADRIELDVIRSRDGKFYVNHDDSLIHTTGQDCFISKELAENLSKLKLQNQESLPTLELVLDTYLRSIEFNIEIKESSAEAAEELAVFLKNKYPQYLHKFVISSFFPEPILHMSRKHPEITRACLWGNVISWPMISFFAPPVFMMESKSFIIHPHTSFVDKIFMEQARLRGWMVIPYTSMNGEDHAPELLWSKLLDLGVDGLCTNLPREFKKYITDIERARSHVFFSK